MVGPSGLEPPTSTMSTLRSNQLSYGPPALPPLCDSCSSVQAAAAQKLSKQRAGLSTGVRSAWSRVPRRGGGVRDHSRERAGDRRRWRGIPGARSGPQSIGSSFWRVGPPATARREFHANATARLSSRTMILSHPPRARGWRQGARKDPGAQWRGAPPTGGKSDTRGPDRGPGSFRDAWRRPADRRQGTHSGCEVRWSPLHPSGRNMSPSAGRASAGGAVGGGAFEGGEVLEVLFDDLVEGRSLAGFAQQGEGLLP